MTMPTTVRMRRGLSIVPGLLLVGAVACGRGGAMPATASAAAGPVTIDVVRVVEQPLDVPLSLPAELAPYQSVAIYSKVTGFVKTMRVDRGSRVRAGDLLRPSRRRSCWRNDQRPNRNFSRRKHSWQQLSRRRMPIEARTTG